MMDTPKLTGRNSACALLLAGATLPAHAHHAMDYALPATALEGLLAGLGHPVIGLDHLLFVIGAGVLAARIERGMLLPLAFVAASTAAVGARAAGWSAGLGEIWVAASLVILGAVLLAARGPGRSVVAVLFALAGAVHGHALAEGILGAEATPIYAYLAGLTVIQSVIGVACCVLARRLSKARPALPLPRIAGAALGVAGVCFTVAAAMA